MKRILQLLLFACLLIRCASGYTEPKEPAKPNVLFVSIDDLRPTLGAYGDPVAVTPRLDELAGEGMTFRQVFCQAAVCAPSRASLMTGLRPDSTRVWHLGDKFREINPAAVTMPQYFTQFGYHTVNIGKIFHNYMPDSVSWHEPDLRPAQYLRPDWLGRDGETFYISESVNQSQAIKRDSLLQLQAVRYADGWNTGPAWEDADVHDTLYYDGAQTELAKRTLTRLAKTDQPFYFGLGYFRPHLPFAVPKKYWDLYDPGSIPLAPNPDIPEGAPIWSMNSMYELRHYDGFGHIGHPTSAYRMSEDTARILKHGYYASVSYVDALLGDLIDHLKALNLYDNTIIIVWGDHGWKLGDHNSWGKMTNYNIDLQVPLIVRYPGQEKRGVQTSAIVELVDMFPSLCELAGIEIPDYAQGTSFVPLLEDPERAWKTAAFSQFHRRPRVAADGGRYMGYSINTPDYHYIEWYTWDHRTGTRGEYVKAELYDRRNDPHEKENVADREASAAVVQDLSAQLAAGWKKAVPQ
ncbi:sulfatase [Flavilitoribacter nigricans]|uniref:Iduronate sulfatase n=1 Tax=Flavilitoribacter nigricans (strain ATCC 23147 / DSM 23189 / NBRC 102662 / NCIMB 1420 / SS-2) TaxID=1122177 RepID=A0A2D0MYA3_FLAN2|nr:sulfatase [Flavilitoribacter nigricans]PHN01244.1 iduronate sulfatase [Flavilitoribacter nigricans DSM 23189 = NBRC 102662]